MRVLILADSCNPEWPSLPVVGYKAVKALSAHVEVVLATHIRNRPAIEAAGGCGTAEIRYIDNEFIAKPMYALSKFLRGGNEVGWTTHIATIYPSYLAFEWKVWRAFRSELKAGKFDVVHRITPMSPTIPSPLARWSKVPFVLGPLNGGLKWPAEFTAELKREKEYLTYLRNAYRMLPYYRSTYSRSAAILAGFQHTIDDLPKSTDGRVIDFPEVGIDPEVFSSSGVRPPRERKIILYAGRFVPYKCPDVPVAAFARNPELRKHRLVMVGDGPERERIETIIKEHSLEDCVELLGWKTQAEVGQLMCDADVFAFPSIRELGAGAVVEAMACGLAMAVVDYGAPAGLVTKECGVKIPLADKNALIDSYASELASLVTDEARLKSCGQAAHERALRVFSWDAKAVRTLAVYEWVTGQRVVRPAFEETTNESRSQAPRKIA